MFKLPITKPFYGTVKQIVKLMGNNILNYLKENNAIWTATSLLLYHFFPHYYYVCCDNFYSSLYRVKHKCEGEGKTTATHAKILAPGYVNIYEFPTKVPVYSDLSRVVLAFPHEVSLTSKK